MIETRNDGKFTITVELPNGRYFRLSKHPGSEWYSSRCEGSSEAEIQYALGREIEQIEKLRVSGQKEREDLVGQLCDFDVRLEQNDAEIRQLRADITAKDAEIERLKSQVQRGIGTVNRTTFTINGMEYLRGAAGFWVARGEWCGHTVHDLASAHAGALDDLERYRAHEEELVHAAKDHAAAAKRLKSEVEAKDAEIERLKRLNVTGNPTSFVSGDRTVYRDEMGEWHTKMTVDGAFETYHDTKGLDAAHCAALDEIERLKAELAKASAPATR